MTAATPSSNLLTELEDVALYLSEHGTPDMGYDQVVERALTQLRRLTRISLASRALLTYLDVHDWGTIPEGQTADTLRDLLAGTSALETKPRNLLTPELSERALHLIMDATDADAPLPYELKAHLKQWVVDAQAHIGAQNGSLPHQEKNDGR